MKLLGLGKKILLSNLKRLSEPYKITFAVTYKCNSRCKTCGIWKKESKNELKLEEIEKIFDKLNNLSWVDLTGGEIFLRDDIEKIMKTIIEKSENLYMLHFPTNGLLTEKIVNISSEIKKMDIPKFVVSISLDGPREIHDEIRGVEGNFDKAMETYKALDELGIDVYFGMTLSDYNIGKYEETLEQLKKEIPGFDEKELHTNIYHTSKHYYSNKKHGDREELIKDLKKCERNRRGLTLNPIKILEYKYIKRAIDYVKEGEMPLPCKSLSASCFIDPKGNVYPCSIYNRKIGSLRNYNYSLEEIWNSEKAEKIIEEIKNLECGGCWTPCEAYQTILGNLLRG